MHILLQNDYVELWTPFEVAKAEEGDVDKDGRPLAKISGYCSTVTKDSDEQWVDQNGLDFSKALTTGFFTYEHPLGAINIVGFPTQTAREVIQKADKSVDATRVTGYLYKDDKLGKVLLEKAVTMAKAGGQRRLGFSIEGKLKPGGKVGNCLRAVDVRSIAISPAPKNPDTWWEPVMHSLNAALVGNEPVTPEWLEQAVWKAEAMGYPAQGAAASGAGGVPKLALQSIQNGALDFAKTPPIPQEYLQGLTADDLLVARILKKLPSAKWSQGLDVLKVIREGMNKNGDNT